MNSNVLTWPDAPVKAREVARIIGMSYATVKNWGARGLLDAYRIPVGGQYRYNPAKVKEAFEAGRFANVGR